MELMGIFFLLGVLIGSQPADAKSSCNKSVGSVGGMKPPGVSFCQSGKEQSPVNIMVDACKSKNYPHEALLDDILFTNDILYENNCETVKITLFNQTLKPMVQGGALENMTYIIDNIHFHWGTVESEGCEHTINGRHFPMEAHLVVYKSAEQDFDTALANKNIAVLSFLFELDNKTTNAALNELVAAIKQITQPCSTFKTSGASLAFLKDYIGGGFYTYRGSLTTHDCKEGVLWMIHKKSVLIGPSQLMIFHDVLSDDGKELQNWRKTNPLNDRLVWQSTY